MRVQSWFWCFALAAAAAAQAPAPSPGLANGTRINAQLKSAIDSQHARVGDKVTAVTTAAVKSHGKTELPKGTTLTGRITEVTAAQGGGSASRIGVLFDQAVTQQGRAVPLRAGIVSVLGARGAAAANGMPAMAGGMDAMAGAMAMPAPMPAGGGMRAGAGLGGVVGGAAAGVGAGLGAVASAPLGMPAMPVANGRAIARDSNGAALRILPPLPASAGQRSALGSELSTPRGNLKLNSGTRVQLQVMH